MIVAVDLPAVRHRFEQVGPAVVVEVAQPGDLAALHGIERAIFLRQAQYFVQPTGKQLVLRVGGVAERVADQIDLAAAGRHGQPSVGHQLERPGLQQQILRNRQGDEPIKIVFGHRRVVGAQRAGDQQQQRNDNA